MTLHDPNRRSLSELIERLAFSSFLSLPRQKVVDMTGCSSDIVLIVLVFLIRA